MNPDYVQINYDRVLSAGLPGSNANANPTYDASFIAVGDVPYGVVISTAGTSNPKEAKAGKSNVAATAGYLYGTGTIAEFGDIKEITAGALNVDIDGTLVELTALNFASASSYEAVASALTSALDGKATAVFADGVFKITSAKTGAGSAVRAVISDGDVGVAALLGLDKYVAVEGKAGVTASAMGVVIRNVVDEAGAGANSNITTVKNGDVGAFRQDGAIKVMAKEAVTEGADVYFDAVTGELYGASASGHTDKLGTSKWKTTVNAGEVGVIDITGLR